MLRCRGTAMRVTEHVARADKMYVGPCEQNVVSDGRGWGGEDIAWSLTHAAKVSATSAAKHPACFPDAHKKRERPGTALRGFRRRLVPMNSTILMAMRTGVDHCFRGD